MQAAAGTMSAPEANDPMAGATILVVDDDERLRSRLARALSVRGLVVTAVGSGAEALEEATRSSPELALVDLRMPGMSGLDLVRELHRRDETTRIVVLTGYGSIATALDAVRLGAVHYLTKPADIDEILAAFSRGATHAERFDAVTVLSLDVVEREHIERVLDECGGNITAAAKRLRIHRRSLQRKLGRLD